MSPAGSSPIDDPASSIDAGSSAGSIGAPDQQLQGIHVLREQRLLLREVGLRLVEDLLGLAEIGPRSDPAFEPQPGQPNALFRGSRGLFGDQQQARVGGIIEPGIGDVGDQGQPGRARAGFGRQILLELRMGQRAQPAEQVEFEAGHVDADG